MKLKHAEMINRIRRKLLKISARDLYPDADENVFGVYNYNPIIHSMGKVAWEMDIGDYQGTMYRILHNSDENAWGYLEIGWGSCSVCDMLRACKSYEDVDRLIRRIEADIRWYTSRKALAEYLNNEKEFWFYGSDEKFEMLKQSLKKFDPAIEIQKDD
jgi:hypothetical protein